MEYLLKVSAVVGIFYLSYKLFLQRDTFFEQNRWFLLLGLITAFIVPLIIIPNYIEYIPIETSIDEYDYVAVNSNEESQFNISDYLPLIYGLGVLCFLIRFFIQLTSLGSVIFKNKEEKHGRYSYIKTSKKVSPFSFFNWIVYNPNNFTETELNQIITHEKVHVNQYHSIDILITQLTCIILWFNPFIWFYNKELKQNLEFIADQKTQSKFNCKKSYQYTLLKTSLPTHQLALTNNFYNSLIKKRIVMLHKSKSKKTNLLKYVLVIPLLGVFLMSFNTQDIYIEKEATITEPLIINNSEINTATLLEENESNLVVEGQKIVSKPNKVKPLSIINEGTKKISKKIQEKFEIIIDKNTTDKRLYEIKKSLKEIGIEAKFKGIKRNSKNEITAIKVNVISKISNANYNTNSNVPIKTIVLYITENGKNIGVGTKTTSSKDKDKKKYKVKLRNSKIDSSFVIIKTDNTKDTIYLARRDKTKKHDQKGKGDKYKVRLSNANISDTSKIVIRTDNGKEPIYIVNGKELTEEEVEKLHPDQINNVSVIKGKKATAYYGDKGKNGVVVIEKKKNNKSVIDFDVDEEENSEEEIIIIREDKDPDNFVIRSTGKKKNKPLIIIDGKETKDNIKDLDTDDIEKINVVKGEKATEKYGDKGKNGVIEIITKKK